MRQEKAAAYLKMQEGNNTRAPFAFIRYCVTSPDACRIGQQRTVDWTPGIKALVGHVNRSVNRGIRPVSDRGRDVWQANVAVGDCEEFALTKRERLMKEGMPASALRIAVATTGSGEGHAVLVVSTADGDFVLDNRNDQILIWHQTDLTFQKIASAEDPRLWHRLA
ncbi:transglutaminase-like cysteine peptidase [Aureimonas phyllosphaerae]|uniref:Putative transglutaminase-like cysteine proteinase n=1 Tax=Aureimonas phyllosphaerae TaxID=1166078 RepID=A0A7W6FWA9_9HYPH|nr:transglutaminase-like cysteine peptidase [Aureimonas phyllosphaerae]MBB3938011.1 putative transglutaminase-like cysteine proteinase [Aureimonas phyllosphaerae]MBB3962018.1 putative transglutaminase-like cysteine proteinase [Aureimonas phyllosphaerae]